MNYIIELQRKVIYFEYNEVDIHKTVKYLTILSVIGRHTSKTVSVIPIDTERRLHKYVSPFVKATILFSPQRGTIWG